MGIKKLILGDCFDRIKNIQDNSIDLLFVDPPYKKTNLGWDESFDLSIFNEFRRVINKSGVIVVFGREPLLSYHRITLIDLFKYDYIWKKNRKNGYVLANTRPLQETEKIAVFSKGSMKPSSCTMSYFPQFTRPCHKKFIKGKLKPKYISSGFNGGMSSGRKEYPTDIIECDQEWKPFHPTEKPLELFEYLVLTYSKIGDTVLDCCFGSGNSIIAAKNLHRNFIGIEKDKEYFNRLTNLICTSCSENKTT